MVVAALACLFAGWAEVTFAEPALRVNLTTGVIEGRYLMTLQGNRGRVFQGIPYAEAPIGSLRFQLPKAPGSWSGIIQTKKYAAACLQNETESPYHPDVMSEDCLYLNVFAPVRSSSSESFPVLFYVHGGGWEYDSVRMFPPQQMIDSFVANGVIVVLPAYRMGVFGFWSTFTPDAIGNIALYAILLPTGDLSNGHLFADIILALQWTQQNIRAFGGDPSRVTIQGHSSAGQGVSLLALSPKTDGLFQQVVPMSGSAFGMDGIQEEYHEYFAVSESLGCGSADCRKKGSCASMVACMQKINAYTLMNAYKSIVHGTAPRIDGSSGILPLPVSQLANSRRPLPVLTGTVIYEIPFMDRSDPQPSHEQIAVMCAGCARSQAVLDACILHYDVEMRHRCVSWTFQPLKEILADCQFYAGQFLDAATARDAGADAYIYSFDFIDYFNNETGPSHAVDLTYVFGIHPFPLSENGKRIRKYYGMFFSNFAKFAKPDPSARKLRPSGFNYFSVDLVPRNLEFYHFDAVQFWDRVVPYLERFSPNASIILQPNSSVDVMNRMKNKRYPKTEKIESKTTPSDVAVQTVKQARTEAKKLSIELSKQPADNNHIVQTNENGATYKSSALWQFSLIGSIAAITGLVITIVLGISRKRSRARKGCGRTFTADENTPLLID